MKKSPSPLLQAIILSGSYTAYHIGSGFATGNEILQFFVSWGNLWPLWVFLIALIFTVVTNYIMYRTGFVQQFENANECYYYYCGPRIGRLFDYYVYLTLVAFVLVMITGSGATIHQHYGLPEYVGTVGMGILCAAAACLGLRRLVDILGGTGIVILVFTVGCGLYMIFTSDVSPLEGAKNTLRYVQEGKILQPNVLGVSHPVAAGLSYSGILMLALPWISSVGKLMQSKKQAGITAILSAVFFFSAAASVALALMLNLDAVAGVQIPMLAAVSHALPALSGLYSVVIILGIFSTATGQLFLLADRFAKEGTAKFRTIIFGTVAFAVVGGTFLPFDVIVNIVYSVLGLSGVVLAMFLVAKFVRTESRT